MLLITAGCRLGFDNVDPASNGDDDQGSGSGSNVVQLSCGGPQRFVVGADLNGIAASPTSAGFVVTTVDSDGNVKGWSYTLDNGTLAANVAEHLSRNERQRHGGDRERGQHALGGGAERHRHRPSVRSPPPIAFAARTAGRAHRFRRRRFHSRRVGGTFAYVSQLGDTSIELMELDAMGNEVGSTLTLTTMPDMAYSPTVVAGPNGYAVVYGGSQINSGAAIALYDTELTPLIAPQTIEPNPSYWAEQPVLAYAAASNDVSRGSGHQKDSMNFDFVYARLLGSDFAPVGEPFDDRPVQRQRGDRHRWHELLPQLHHVRSGRRPSGSPRRISRSRARV